MNEKTLQSQRVFDGRLLKVDVVDVKLDSGARSTREIVRHPGAVLVMGMVPSGSFVFVRQFRKAVERELLEAVAGTREPGEAPEVCAIREMKEETGYDVESLTYMGFIYSTPGFCNERIDMYFAKLRASPGSQASDPEEHTDVVLLSRNEIEKMIAGKQIHDTKTLAAWLQLMNLEQNPRNADNEIGL